MKNYLEIFEINLINRELSQSRKHGVKIVVPIRSFIIDKTIKNSEHYVLPESLIHFYEEINSMIISWSISKKNHTTIDIFKNDKWIINNYLNNDYDWSVVQEYLSGYINITSPENILNSIFIKEQGFYHTLSKLDVNQDDYYPLDITWSLTACVKKENGRIIDNIWLVHTDAETIYDMKITIKEYFDLAYQAKCFHYWQLIYVLKEKSDYFELMKRFLPKIAPHIELDLSAFGIKKTHPNKS